MSWIYVPESVDSPLPLSGSSEDSKPSAMSKSTNIVNNSSNSESKMDISMTPQSGQTLKHSTGDPGADRWILSLLDSHAHPIVLREKDCMGQTKTTYGRKSNESLEKSGQTSFYARTYQGSRHTCPWCTMTSENLVTALHRLYELAPPLWAQDILGDASSFLPTLTATEYGSNIGGVNGRAGKVRPSLQNLVRYLPMLIARDCRTIAGAARMPNAQGSEPLTVTMGMRYMPTLLAGDAKQRKYQRDKGQKGKERPTLCGLVGSKLNPNWTDWYMGFPIGWSNPESLPAGDQSFQQWLQKHGRY